MIDISELRESDKGRGVIYVPAHGNYQRGIISSWNEQHIFVRYTTGCTAAATNPDQLHWEIP